MFFTKKGKRIPRAHCQRSWLGAEPGLYLPSRPWASYLASLGLNFPVPKWCQWGQHPKGASRGPEYACEAQLMCSKRLIHDNKNSCYCLWYNRKAEDEVERWGAAPGRLIKVKVNGKESTQPAQRGGRNPGATRRSALPR